MLDLNKLKFEKTVSGQGLLRQMTSVVLLTALMLTTACSLLETKPLELAEPKAVSLDGDLLYLLLAAEFAGNAGELDKSVDFYRQAAISSSDSRIAARATYIAMYNKQYDAALALLDRWRELDPESQDTASMYAMSYLHLHRPMDAFPYVQAIIKRHGGDSKKKAMVVKQLLSKDVKTEDGLIVLNALNQAQTDNPQMLILQARFAAELKQYDQSVELLDRVIELDASLVDVYIIKSRIYLAQGKRDESKAVIMQVLAKYPDNLAIRLQYAQMLVEDKEYKAAREQYLILSEKQPDNVDVLLSLSLINIEVDLLDEAAESLAHLIEMDKKVDIANYYLGRIAQSKKQHKNAIAFYIKVKNGVYVFEAKLRIASLFARLDRADEAIEQLKTLSEDTEDWSDRVRAYLAQGEILRSLRKYEEAFNMYSRALSFNKEDINLLYARALTADKVDRIDVAESDLLKVLSMEPKNSDALNALGYTLADRTDRYQEAREYIKKAMDLVPDDPAIMDSLGWVNYRLGDMQAALKWLSLAFEKLVDAEIAAHYGEVLWQVDQKEKAKAVWKKGKEANDQHPVLVETLKKFKQ